MAHTTLANSTDLDNWADRIASRSEVPRLLRRLIQATCRDVQRIGFPADEGVQLSGWDGIAHSIAGDAYVPPGVSAWEAGANVNVKAKADEDYEKRSQNPLDVFPIDSTFAFVTPRRWGGKGEWVRTRNAEGVWREVRAYDAEDLAQWLEQAPAVHVWLSEQIGKRPPGMQSLDDFWTTWANETRPPLPPALVVGGRVKERDQVLSWLRSAPAPLSLAGDSSKETIAFLAGVLQEADAVERSSFLSRSVVVESAEAWRSLGPSATPLILIPRFAEPEGVGKVVQQGHHVFVPLDRAGAASATVLPRLVRASAEQALLAMGMNYERASSLATLARISLSALRRNIAVAPGLLAPAWARPEVARELIAPLLAGAWQASAVGDQAALSRLAGMPYEMLLPILTRKMNEPEPALRHTADVWMVAGRADAWQWLSPYLTGGDLRAFEATVLDVLCEVDPALDLPINHRSFANWYGKSRLHSGHLRNWLAETLSIMAAFSPSSTIASSGTGEDYAQRVVRSLLAQAKGKIEVWASLSRELPTLAEAAPSAFLDAVSEEMIGEAPTLVGIFQDQEQSLFGSSPHAGLLWALETLAWSGEHFGRAVLSLARLARLDPGGRMGNRPANSLRDIFLCWQPNTTVSLVRRLNVLDAIRSREPEVGWRLMMQLLPKMHSTVSPTHKPRWRDWIPEEAQIITVSEYLEATDGVLDRLLSDAGGDVGRWSDLIEAVGGMTVPQRQKLIEHLEVLDINLFSSEERGKVQDALRSIIGRHREFPDAEWSMPTAETDRLERVHDRFRPEDPIVRFRWLFKRWVEVPGLRRVEWEQRNQAVRDLRVEALKDIYRSESWPGLLRLAEQVEDAHSIGAMLLQAELAPETQEAFLREYMTASESGHRMMAQGFILASISASGEQWAEDRLAEMQEWPPEQIANFLLCLPFTPLLLDKLEASSEDVRLSFWKGLRSVCLFDDNAQTERVITALLGYGRPDLTLEAIERAPNAQSGFLAPERIADVLEAYVQNPSNPTFDLTSVAYLSAELLDRLDRSDLLRERLVRLEWQYLPLHEHHRPPRLMHEELARDPTFFIEVLNQAYPRSAKKTKEEENEASAGTAVRARMAYTLLDSWRKIPGQYEDTIDAKVLQQWVETVRQLAAADNRLPLADHVFGRVLASSPLDTDSAWPHQAVRELIENLSSQDIEEGWQVQVLNNTGSTTRGLTDGGTQERSLANRYQGFAQQIGDIYPRTAAVLRRLVQEYRSMATQIDERADLTQDFWR